MTKEDRCDLKAKLILEKFKIYFKVSVPYIYVCNVPVNYGNLAFFLQLGKNAKFYSH